MRLRSAVLCDKDIIIHIGIVDSIVSKVTSKFINILVKGSEELCCYEEDHGDIKFGKIVVFIYEFNGKFYVIHNLAKNDEILSLVNCKTILDLLDKSQITKSYSYNYTCNNSNIGWDIIPLKTSELKKIYHTFSNETMEII